MATYKISMYFILQIAIGVSFEDGFFEINIPFIRIMLSTDKYSTGYSIFGKHFN